MWDFLSEFPLVSVPGELDSFRFQILGLSIGVLSINPWQFIWGLSLGAQGTRLFRGSYLRVVYWSFIKKKTMKISPRSKSRCLGNKTLLGFGSWGCQLEYYKKRGSFSEVWIDSLGVWVSVLSIGVLSKLVEVSTRSKLTQRLRFHHWINYNHTTSPATIHHIIQQVWIYPSRTCAQNIFILYHLNSSSLIKLLHGPPKTCCIRFAHQNAHTSELHHNICSSKWSVSSIIYMFPSHPLIHFRASPYLYKEINIFVIFGQGRLAIFHIGAFLTFAWPLTSMTNLIQQNFRCSTIIKISQLKSLPRWL